MKLNKTFGRIATTLVATAMLASLAAPVYAEETGVLTPSEGKITIKKELVMPKDMMTPGVTFDFEITTTSVDEGDTIELGEDTLLVRAGTASNLNAGSATIEEGATGTPDDAGTNKTITVNAELALPTETYSDAGVYKYQIKEKAKEGYTDVTKALDLYLIVERTEGADEKMNTPDDGFQVANAIVYPATDVSGTGTGKVDTYTNYYKLDETGVPEVGSIKVTKKVTGAMGSMNDTFDFYIDLPQGGDYSIINNGQTTPVDFTGGHFSLQNGQSVTITGLPKNASYDITETLSDGYAITEVAAEDQEYASKVSAKTDTDNATKIGATVTVDGGETYGVVITNNRDAVSPTGLIMDIAPYVLLVVVAAAGCFVFLRKRRED